LAGITPVLRPYSCSFFFYVLGRINQERPTVCGTTESNVKRKKSRKRTIIDWIKDGEGEGGYISLLLQNIKLWIQILVEFRTSHQFREGSMTTDWVICSNGIYLRIKIMEMGQVNLRNTNTNIKIYVKSLKGKKSQREREIPL